MPGAPSARLPFPQAYNLAFVLFWTVAVMVLFKIGGAWFLFSAVVLGFIGTGTTRFVALAVLLLAATARSSPMRAVGTPGTLFLLAVVLHIVIGTSVAVYHDEMFSYHWRMQYQLLGLLVVVVAATGVHDVASRIGVDKLLAGILVILTTACISVIAFQVILQVMIAETAIEVRSAGVHEGPNQGAFMSCLTVAMASVMFIWRKHQGWVIASMIVAILSTVAGISRTGVVILAVLCVISVPYVHKMRGPAVTVRIGLAAVVVFALWAWVVSVSPEGAAIRRMTDFDITERLGFWTYGLSRILDAPLTGHGLDTFFEMHDYTHTSCRDTGAMACGIHNQYLLLIGEAGMLPLLLWVLFFAVVFKKCSWTPNSLPKAVAGSWMVCLALYSMVSHVVFLSLANFFVVGVACGLLTWDEAASDADLHRDKPLE